MKNNKEDAIDYFQEILLSKWKVFLQIWFKKLQVAAFKNDGYTSYTYV